MDGYQLYDLLNFALMIIFIIGFVATVMWFKKKENDNRTKVLLTALEKGQEINPELLASKKKNRSINKWLLLMSLAAGVGMVLFGAGMTIVCLVETITEWGTCLDSGVTIHFNVGQFMGCVTFLAIGIGLLVAYKVGKKLLKPELEKEDALAKK